MVTATIVFEPCRLEATDMNLCPTRSPNMEEDLLGKLLLQVHQSDLLPQVCSAQLDHAINTNKQNVRKYALSSK